MKINSMSLNLNVFFNALFMLGLTFLILDTHDTVVLFSLRDFLCSKKASSEALKRGHRVLRTGRSQAKVEVSANVSSGTAGKQLMRDYFSKEQIQLSKRTQEESLV